MSPSLGPLVLTQMAGLVLSVLGVHPVRLHGPQWESAQVAVFWDSALGSGPASVLAVCAALFGNS